MRRLRLLLLLLVLQSTSLSASWVTSDRTSAQWSCSKQQVSAQTRRGGAGVGANGFKYTPAKCQFPRVGEQSRNPGEYNLTRWHRRLNTAQVTGNSPSSADSVSKTISKVIREVSWIHDRKRHTRAPCSWGFHHPALICILEYHTRKRVLGTASCEAWWFLTYAEKSECANWETETHFI